MTLLEGCRELILREQDRDARRAAQTRFDRPLVLQAGAGTGKTTTLIGRLLSWTLGTGWARTERRLAERAAAKPFGRPEEITPDRIAAEVLGRVVAITFTEAAAAEMAGRTARELASLAAGGEVPSWLDAGLLPPQEERTARARALLGTLDHLAVRTIHAFCRGLLADHPLEAGVHPDLSVDADGRRVEEIVREILEDRLREGYGAPGDPHLLALAARGFGPQEMAESLIALLGSGLPAAELAADPFAIAAVRAFRDRLAAACRAVHDLIAPRLRKTRGQNARKIEEGLAALIARLGEGGEAPVGILKEWAAGLLPKNLRDHLHEWSRKRKDVDLFGDLLEELAVAAGALEQVLEHLACLDPEVLEHGRRALGPLLAAVEGELRAQGVATFDFLLTGAERLLARQPEVRRQVRRRIDQLLVDEFQDTDRIQCELLRWLALDGPLEERPGLFLVGDPKQSIYGWRNADLRAYDGFVGLVREAGGEVRSLVENFRSVPVILEEVARVIEPVMLSRDGVQPAFEPLLPCERRQGDPGFVRSGSAGGGWAPVEHWVSWKREDEKGAGRTAVGEAAQIEAVALAADVRVLHEEHGVRWREIALLLRSTGDLDLYLEELRRARVPFAVGRDKQYYRRREVIEAAALVRAILDPGDHLALLTVLRSSTVGVPDAALIPLWNRKLPKRMTELAGPDPGALAALREAITGAAEATPREIPGIERVAGWQRNLLVAVENLARLRLSFATEPADVFVERLRGLTLVEATEAARYLGPYRLANLERFFRQLLMAMEEGGGDVTAILRALRRSVAESREAEEGRPTDGSEDAVSVLTIHGAKGLDFEHVYLLQLHKESPGDRGPRTAAGRVDGGFEYRLFGAPTLGFDRVEAERRQVEAAERVRLLYVAMTRAKDRVVLAGLWPERPDRPDRWAAKPWDQARAPMDLLLSRRGLPDDLHARWAEALAAAPAADNPPAWTFADATGALWKFPALRPPGDLGLAAEPERPSLPGPEEIALVAAGLAAERVRAGARRARPFGGAASEEAHALLREQQAERLASEGPERRRRPGAGAGPVLDRAAAMAAGGAIHRALEEWDLAAAPRKEAGRQRSLLPSYLAALVEGDELERALPVAGALLDTFAGGPLLDRLRGLKDHLLARELPVLLPPGEGDHSPVGVVTGAIDLLYRDPRDGRIVVADYKTDEVETDAEVQTRAAVYAPQGELYTRAIREALELAEPPRFELWFLRVGRVVMPPPRR
ncbi:MAG TPA: UvrD-helicase domain-containing protein [Thermoanaerobaculia bacterium]|nr:UvrD-helicase domain-containing protein [Thermoanaerobaculia bacterium]